MKSPLWSRVLGVILGMFIGAGVVYAVTYEYRTEMPSNVTVASNVTAEPGLQVTPTSLNLGTLQPGQTSSAVSIEVTNIGDRSVGLYFDVTNLPSGMTLYVNQSCCDSNWHACPYDYGGMLEPGATHSHYYRFYVSCSSSVAVDSYNFTTIIREQA